MKLLLSLILCASVQGALIDRIQQKEDATANPATIGDKGKSRGMYQMGFLAWKDVNKVRKSKGLPVYPWTFAHDRKVSREYAEQYLDLLRNDLRAALRRSPTNAELYCSYALGFSGFKERGLLLKNCPAWLQRKAKDL